MFNANKRVMQSSSWMRRPKTTPRTLLSLEKKEEVKTENQIVPIMPSLTELNQNTCSLKSSAIRPSESTNMHDPTG